MPTIDTTTIEGFDAMSDSDKLSALLKFEIPEKVDLSQYVSKATFDKTASELADKKKALNDRMSEDERTKAEADSAMKDLQTKYEALLKESTISKFKAEYLAQGYSDELAAKAAKAMAEGDTAKVFEYNKTFKAELEKNLKAELLKNTPKPGGSEGDGKEDDKPYSVQLAESIGKRNAAASAQTKSILDKYKIGG